MAAVSFFSIVDSGGSVPLSAWSRYYLEQLVIDLGQFFLFGSLFYIFFYVAFPRVFFHRKVQPNFPSSSDVRREILLSVQSVAIFAAFGFLIIYFFQRGWTRIYLRPDAYGWPYFILSFFLFLFIQDAWFYWVHRFLHWAPIYRKIHHVHHRSQNPTPWAAFSFHPLEAVANALIFPIVILLIPVNLWIEWLWFIYMFFISVYLHVGYEIMPKIFVRHWFYRWSTGAVHHNMHHSHVRCNYGLYFTIWDWLMGTKHPDYEKLFEDVAHNRKSSVWTTKGATPPNKGRNSDRAASREKR